MKIKSFSVKGGDWGFSIFALTECGQLFQKVFWGNADEKPRWESVSDDLPVDEGAE